MIVNSKHPDLKKWIKQCTVREKIINSHCMFPKILTGYKKLKNSTYLFPRVLNNIGTIELNVCRKIDIETNEVSLYPYQSELVEHVLENVYTENKGIAYLQLDTGLGKCMGINTPIIMYDGTIKMIQDIIIGDTIMGDDSTPRVVLQLCRGHSKMYRISHKNNMGEPYVVNEEHKLVLKNIM